MDYYAILDLDISANTSEISRAYRKMAVKYHPDKNIHDKKDAEIRFKLVNEAYEVLTNSEKRRKYDTSYIARKRCNLTGSTYEVEVDRMGVGIHDMTVHNLTSLDEAFADDVSSFIHEEL